MNMTQWKELINEKARIGVTEVTYILDDGSKVSRTEAFKNSGSVGIVVPGLTKPYRERILFHTDEILIIKQGVPASSVRIHRDTEQKSTVQRRWAHVENLLKKYGAKAVSEYLSKAGYTAGV